MSGLQLENITKRFDELTANLDVSFVAELGRIHALVGENGAGKTTLMRIAYGLVEPDAGRIMIGGTQVTHHSPRRAKQLGVGMVHQHFALVPTMTVIENLLLGDQGFALDRGNAEVRLRELADNFGLEIDPQARVGELPVALRQRVEIIKMLFHDADIVILDEPTSALAPSETRDLLTTLRTFRDAGKAVVFVSHKLPEVLAVADEISVLRRGELVAHVAGGETTETNLARLIVGTVPPVTRRVSREIVHEIALELRNVTVPPIATGSGLRDFSLTLRAGEIVGVAAVAGNGQRELVRSIVGLCRIERGEVLLNGRDVTPASVSRRRSLGIGYMPEERLGEGINTAATVEDNLILGLHRSKGLRRRFWLRRGETRKLAEALISGYDIRASGPGTRAGTLSGGNLQRIIAAREIALGPRIFLAEEPTGGLDIQAATFIRAEILRLSQKGVAVLLVSSDLEELFDLADRLIVLYQGRVAGSLTSDQASEDQVGAWMVGAEA